MSVKIKWQLFVQKLLVMGRLIWKRLGVCLLVIRLMCVVFCTEISYGVQNVSEFAGHYTVTSCTAAYLQVWDIVVSRALYRMGHLTMHRTNGTWKSRQICNVAMKLYERVINSIPCFMCGQRTRWRHLCQQSWSQGLLLCRTHCFPIAVAVAIISTHVGYPRRDDQAELVWVAWLNTTHLSTNRARRRATALMRPMTLPLSQTDAIV